MTILEVIQRSAEFLGKKGVSSPRLQVELLLAHALKMPRMKLYLNFERVLSDAEIQDVRELVRRRGLREPLQYIVGSTSFCGFEIAVNRNVLIPRPETELLAERAWKFLVELKDGNPRALDLCTGSGCLAIALAARSPAAKIDATDVSKEALDVARQNAERNNVAAQITFQCGDAFSAIDKSLRYDLIVSNPPYIPSADVNELEQEVRDFEPHLALDGGTDGFDFYRTIAAQAGLFLNPAGRLMVELNDDTGAMVGKIFAQAGWTTDAVDADYSGRERIFIAHKAAQSHD